MILHELVSYLLIIRESTFSGDTIKADRTLLAIASHGVVLTVNTFASLGIAAISMAMALTVVTRWKSPLLGRTEATLSTRCPAVTGTLTTYNVTKQIHCSPSIAVAS